MPIIEISKGAHGPTLLIKCVECGSDQKVEESGLTLGTEHHADVVALPPCSCGAQEFLQRTFDVHPNESHAGHRKAVNALGEHLKATGRTYEKHRDAIATSPTPKQIGSLYGKVRGVAVRRQAPKLENPAVTAALAALKQAQDAYAKATAGVAAGTTSGS